MAPRNNEADANYQKKTCPEDSDTDLQTAIPSLMHKKHRVVKLVKSQLQKIHDDGLCGGSAEILLSDDGRNELMSAGPSKPEYGRMRAANEQPPEPGYRSGSHRRGGLFCCYLLAFCLAIFILVFLMVWISAGPLSNSMVHTPVPASSFVRTDSVCSLEKKYLLRWSRPEVF